MLNLITMPFRLVRASRFVLIALGALISGFGLWMQIKGVPPGVDPIVAALRSVMTPVLDGQVTVFGLFSKIGGVLALLGLLGMTIHDIAPAAPPNSAKPDAAPDLAAPEMRQTPAETTWQERLAAKTADNPNSRKAQPRAAGSVLRVGVIGLVICAFLAVLGATFLGQSGPNGTQQTVAANLSPAQAMIRSHLAASGVTGPVRSADTALTIPKFDPSTIVPWVKDQLALALAGDQEAMITLGSIVGGIFVLMLGIKIMFAVRRDKARQQARPRGVSYS
jgi:hypothetical protein